MYADLSTIENNYKVTDFPLNIAIEVTNHCNLNCVMCGNDKIKRPRGYMSMTLYKKIIDEVATKSPSTRLWLDFYGEAMLAGWKLYYMIDYAKKAGCTNVCINTNGTLMNKEYADMLLDAGTDYISLDCDGYSKEVYESIRVGGNRDTFYKNVEYLLEEKKRRGCKTVIDVKIIEMDKNRHEVDKIVQYWRERGAWTAVRRLMTWAGEKAYGDADGDVVQDDCNRIACGSLIGTCAITWDGYVASCALDAECKINYGNVEQEGIQQIWMKRNADIVAIHMEHRWNELNELCQKCTDWQIVGENRYDETGNSVDKSYSTDKKIFKE